MTRPMASPTYPLFPVLLIDDEAQILKSFEIALKSAGIKNLLLCSDPLQIEAILAREKIFTVLLDLNMPRLPGQEILRHLGAEYPDIPVIIISGNNDLDTAVACMKEGAFDYMVKPVERSRLVSGVKRAIEMRELQYENYRLKQRILGKDLDYPEVFAEIVTNNQAMLSLFQYAESIAGSLQPVLITGETGVGKELMARAVHRLSGRTGESVFVNVAGIDDNAFTDTLFGHLKGAFTGADSTRAGLVEKAGGGTLVLDEIGDLSRESQVKLLRLIQQGEYYPLGSDIAKATDARIVVCTNQDLQAMQEKGEFRKDLFFRLRAHRIHLPPLRSRLDDLGLLLDSFIEAAAVEMKRPKLHYPEQLLHLLGQYAFPGNVRELRAMVYDAVGTSKGNTISLQSFHRHLGLERQSGSVGVEAALPSTKAHLQFSGTLPSLKAANRLLIEEAMRRCRDNQSMAARLLGISRQTLARHLQPED